MLRWLMLIGAAYLLTRLLRVLPVLARWAAEGRRPLACNVCMAVWSALLALVLRELQPRALDWAAVAGGVLWALELAEVLRPPPLPPPMLAPGPEDV